jgi:prolyl oligopeptidase
MAIVSLLISAAIQMQAQSYPKAPKFPLTDTLYGKIVVDDYRWMEDMKSDQTLNWLKAEADLTENLLKKIPGREALLADFRKLDTINKVSISYPIKGGNRYFYKKTLAGENEGRLYYREGKDGKDILLFDPKTYGNGKLTYWYSPSHDGKKITLILNDPGNVDVKRLKTMEVENRKFYPDDLYPVLGTGPWTPGDRGYFYTEPPTNDPQSTQLFLHNKLKYHELGTQVEKDKLLISATTNPGIGITESDWGFNSYSDDDKYIISTWGEGGNTSLKIYLSPANDLSKMQWRQIVEKSDDVTAIIIHNDSAYLLTRKNTPNYKIIVRSVNDPGKKERVVVPEEKDNIQWMGSSKDYLFYQTTDGVNSSVYQYHFITGKLQKVKLPFTGTPWISPANTKSNECMLFISSWKQPQTIYDYDVKTGAIKVSAFNIPVKYPGADQLVVEEVEAKSHDGVMVPLSIIYNRNIKKNGNNIVYLRGYGSYAATFLPYFNPMDMALLNRGVIVAIAHVRGGGEKGDAWYKGGLKATKPNTWKDFIACAEWLVQKKFTSPKQIIGEGTSAGGIMIGRAMTERPDLFAVAVNDVPVSNPVRGEFRPNGLMDAREFGTLKDSAETMALIEMDTYGHIQNGVSYPAVLAVTGLDDTRVPFWQPGKMVARMQDMNPDNKPVMLLVSFDAGHWTDDKLIGFRNYANRYAFALWQTGHKDFQILK